MFWLPLIMGAAALTGGIIQAKGKKYLDPSWVDEHLGASQFASELKRVVGELETGPNGQEMYNEAAKQGQMIADSIRANATAAGFGGPEGVQSGGSLFATSTADQAGNALRSMARKALYDQAANMVNQSFERRLNAQMQLMQQPTKQELLGQSIANAGMIGLQASLNQKPADAKPKTDTNTAQTATTDVATPVTMQASPAPTQVAAAPPQTIAQAAASNMSSPYTHNAVPSNMYTPGQKAANSLYQWDPEKQMGRLGQNLEALRWVKRI